MNITNIAAVLSGAAVSAAAMAVVAGGPDVSFEVRDEQYFTAPPSLEACMTAGIKVADNTATFKDLTCQEKVDGKLRCMASWGNGVRSQLKEKFFNADNAMISCVRAAVRQVLPEMRTRDISCQKRENGETKCLVFGSRKISNKEIETIDDRACLKAIKNE